MAGKSAPYCAECRTDNFRNAGAIQRVYTRKPNGKGYQPIGWLCTFTLHMRFDARRSRSPEADPVATGRGWPDG